MRPRVGSVPRAGRLCVTVVSDTHLSPRAPEADANWAAVIDHVARTLPDVVLHLGDLTLDGMNDASELRRARGLLDRLPVPWHAVPGNHDVGDNPLASQANGGAITPERHESWLDAIGTDRWALDLAGWTLIGLNAQAFGSGLAAESDQWRWLSSQLDAVPADRPTVLVMHKPLSARSTSSPSPRLTATCPGRHVGNSSAC
jgi:3',5'-cyclic AMP phosphodiesterase CpdA